LNEFNAPLLPSHALFLQSFVFQDFGTLHVRVMTVRWACVPYTRCGCEFPCVVYSMHAFILKLTEEGHLRSTSTEQLCNYPDDTATVGNIFETPVVE